MIFLFISIITFATTAYLIPKRLSFIEIYITTLFAYGLVMLADIILDLKFDLYGYFNRGVDYLGILAQLILSPAAAIITINYFPYKKKAVNKIAYTLIVSVIYDIYEWLSLKFGYFYYNGWHLIYSAILYPFLILLMAWNISFVRKKNKPEKQ